MSHFAKHQTHIKIVNVTLARELTKLSLQYLAKRRNGQVTNIYHEYSGNEYRGQLGAAHKAELAFMDKIIKRGIAVQFENGELSFYGDAYGYEEEFEKFKAEFKQAYAAMQIVHNGRQLHYKKLEVKTSATGQILVHAVA